MITSFKPKEKKIKGLPEIRALLLAGGLGTRLKPLTYTWPKCLMPIGERPLLEYWVEILLENGISKILINLHHHAPIVRKFLQRSRFKGIVSSVYEKKLLGTAGTLKANEIFFHEHTTLLVHADNWCQCNFADFLNFHKYRRPDHCSITMMTFESSSPESCGIVETDEEGVVQEFHEKIMNPPGKIANGAVYILEPEVLNWIKEQPNITDFSTEVLPNFLGRIGTWHNKDIHRDIGDLRMLKLAQSDPKPLPIWQKKDLWQKKFLKNPVHQQISGK